MSDTAEEEGFEPIEAIYAGRRRGHGDKPFILFYLPDGSDATFNSPASLRVFRRCVIGGVYELRRKGTRFILADKYVKASDDERVAAWRAAELADDVALRAVKRIAAEREKAKGSVHELLRPIRHEYNKTDAIGRLALEVVLLHALRRGD